MRETTVTDAGVIGHIREHLGALPGGVGCRHLARERDGVEATLLVRLGLVKPVTRGAPRCADHGCPWQARCLHWPAFEPEATGSVAGVKYKPTAFGLAAADDAGRVAAAVEDLPAAREVLALLAAGPASVFALHGHFLRRARLAARGGDEADPVGLDRVALGGVLDLLVEVGRVERGEDGATYAMPADGAAG